MKIIWPFVAGGAVIIGGMALAVSIPNAPAHSVATPKPGLVSQTVMVSPTPSATPSATPQHVVTKKPKATTTPKPTPSPLPPGDEGSQRGAGIWTPYNPNCYADCFPDLTQERVEAALAWYQGSYQTPAKVTGGDPVFKGLLKIPLTDHYACEYFHVVGYLPAFKECDSAGAMVDPSKP